MTLKMPLLTSGAGTRESRSMLIMVLDIIQHVIGRQEEKDRIEFRCRGG